jgi:predicted dehydrogenase
VTTVNPLRLGIVGSGMIAPYHLDGFRAHADKVEVIGACSHAPSTPGLVRFTTEAGIAAYPGFEELLADSDALVIASVNELHEAQVAAAVAAGKHVLVEKPVVTDPSALGRLAVLARQNPGVVLMPAHNYRYRPAFVAALEALREGRLGPVIQGSFHSSHTISEEHATGWRSRLAESGGGALMDSGHHQVYMAIAAFGRPRAVFGSTSRLVRTAMEGEDLAHAVLHYDGLEGPGAPLVTVTQSWASDQAKDLEGQRIYGTSGYLTVTDDDLYLDGVAQGLAASYESSFEGQAGAFADAIASAGSPDSPDPLAGLREAGDALATIRAAYESARTGRVVELERPPL